MKKNGKVFGSSLQNYQLARIQPLVITIRDQIESEGIFRKPGSRQRQRDLRDQLDKGDVLPSVINVNDAADLLKAFLRELPNPLLPSEHFGTHISIADMKTCEGKYNQWTLSSLSKTHFRSRGQAQKDNDITSFIALSARRESTMSSISTFVIVFCGQGSR